MKFVFKADTIIEAENIDDALNQLGMHFACMSADMESGLNHEGEIIITPAKNGEHVSCPQ